jgi:hypothetical protein
MMMVERAAGYRQAAPLSPQKMRVARASKRQFALDRPAAIAEQ